MWIMPLHLLVNKKSDYDDDDTSTLKCQNRVSAIYLLYQTMDSGQSLYIGFLWHSKELIRFW